MYVPCVFNYSRKMYIYIYLEGSCSNVAVMSRIQQFSNRKKCLGNEHLISRRNDIKNEVLVKGELFLYINALGLV
jgi:hypothetical protein